MVTWFRFCRHRDVAAFEATGWRSHGPLPGAHGHWSVLMEWCGHGEPSADPTPSTIAAE